MRQTNRNDWNVRFEVTFYGNDPNNGSFREIKEDNIVFNDEFVIKNNEFTGEVDGVPCFREGKVTKVEDWVKSNGYDLSEATFYSDSFNDLPLLEKVKTAIVVDGDNELIKQAKSNDWECISFR